MMRIAAAPAGFRPARLPGVLFFVLFAILGCCFRDLRCDAQGTLPKEEVDTLRRIAAKLKIPTTLWDFSLNPCSGEGNWTAGNVTQDTVASNLGCNCNNTTNVCNVGLVQLKGQNLTGELPEEFGNLPSLTEIDLTRNYINGTIPAAAWAKLPLRRLSLLGNRLSGALPDEIGDISTLESLVLEDNRLQGPLPRSLGNLTGLARLLLSANFFSGELPETMGNMKNLTDFRIDGNDISGKIPSFIGNWINLNRLEMQGTSLEGPFPPIFSTLKNILQLRVSNLKKTDGSFPPLENMLKMQYLVLRSCSITGRIPDYIGRMTNLKLLDLSFNNLTGPIPINIQNSAASINDMYLTNNMLNGSLPSRMLGGRQNMDLSYNTFTPGATAPMPSTCPQGNQNIVASFSSTQDNSVASCLRKNLPCSQKAKNYQFFINCGGPKVVVDNIEYEADTSLQGPSTYFVSESGKWAYISTGVFGGDSNAKYVAGNASTLTMAHPELYTTGRLNPLSLRYYGLCLQNGNYGVSLHFAEIMFTSDQTFSSVGRRVFDVSIQGKNVLEDFNIVEAANGTGKVIVRNFTTLVENNTLEIHFQWAGKGTNAIPQRGVYGPLISAISVTPNFKPDLGEGGKKLPVGAIAGIVAVSCILFMLTLFTVWFLLKRKGIVNDELRGLDLPTGHFSLKQIKSATRNFDPANKIGEGGFGPVYKGVLPDGTAIAVKQLSSKSKQGNREFINEIGVISALQHPHLVKLYGCGIEGNQLLLIYEYMENNSLARALFGPDNLKLNLDWQTRRKICLGIARGLAFLHEESVLKIVHRDIKATNILLDKDLNAKISDFGLAKLDEEDNTHISTRIAGTMGYMAPEYAMRGYLTDKADVYSFGVVILEIVSGKSNSNYRPKEDFFYLLDWAYVLQEQRSLLELVDPRLGPNYSIEEAQQMLNLALVCTSPSPTLRPPMSTVVCMLEGQAPIRVPSVNNPEGNEAQRFKSFEGISHDGLNHSITTDAPWIDSSMSTLTSKGDASSYSATSKLLSDFTE